MGLPRLSPSPGGATALTNNSTPTLTGTATDGTVTVAIDGQAVAGVVVVGSGWTVPYPSLRPALGGGDHYVMVTGTDAAGNVSAVNQTLTVDATLPTIAIDIGAVDATNDQTPTISGTTDAPPGGRYGDDQCGIAHTSDRPGQRHLEHHAASSLSPACTRSSPACRTRRRTSARTQSLTIDIVAPTVTIEGGASRTTGDATPTIAGTSVGAPTGPLSLSRVDGQSLSTTVAAAGLDNDRRNITNGSRVVTVTITDAAGNTGNAAQSLTISAVSPPIDDHRWRNGVDQRLDPDDRRNEHVPRADPQWSCPCRARC